MSGRRGICGCGKGRSDGLDREVELSRIVSSFQTFSVPANMQADIMHAILDRTTWDWFRDCDGCTGVSEAYWPTIYFPPCLWHDYACRRWGSTFDVSRTFYRLQRVYRFTRCRAGLRSGAVWLAYLAWYRWRGYDCE